MTAIFARVEVLIVFAVGPLIFSCGPFDRVEHLRRMSGGGRQITRKLRRVGRLLDRRLRWGGRRPAGRSTMGPNAMATKPYDEISVRKLLNELPAFAQAPLPQMTSGRVAPFDRGQIFRPIDCVVRAGLHPFPSLLCKDPIRGSAAAERLRGFGPRGARSKAEVRPGRRTLPSVAGG